MKVGEVDILKEIMDAKLRIGVLEKVIEILVNTPASLGVPPAVNIQQIRQQVVSDLQRQYPELGIKFE